MTEAEEGSPSQSHSSPCLPAQPSVCKKVLAAALLQSTVPITATEYQRLVQLLQHALCLAQYQPQLGQAMLMLRDSGSGLTSHRALVHYRNGF